MADVKGVSKWSLNPDLNANIDSTINWQEGMMPSSVNNSARAMMSRIREQYDINKAIFNSYYSRFGSRIKYVIVDTINFTKGQYDNNFMLHLSVKDGTISKEEYELYMSGGLFFMLRINVSDHMWDDPIFNQLDIGSLIHPQITINNETKPFEVNYNLFGVLTKTAYVDFYHLKNLFNQDLLISKNTIDIPLDRSFVFKKTYKITENDGGGRPFSFDNDVFSYWRSPTECVLLLNLVMDNKEAPYVNLPIPYSKILYNLRGGRNHFEIRSDRPSPADFIGFDSDASYYVRGGYYKLVIKGDERTRYECPIIRVPLVTSPYPLF